MVPLNQPSASGAEVQVARRWAPAASAQGPCRSSVMRAPDQEDHHHHGGDLHDAQRLAAGFVHALDVAPPEVDGHQHTPNTAANALGGSVQAQMAAGRQISLSRRAQVLARR